MSAVAEDDEVELCASCGTAGSDDIKLKKCTACYLVKYCSVKCQKDHRKQHKRECKKRASELRDKILFKQPESTHLGDCPICCLPLPIGPQKSILMSCCSKRICKGCDTANMKREVEGSLDETCIFCRKAPPETEEEINEQSMKRIHANDPVAMCQMGSKRYYEGDYNSAFEYWTKAAALGDAEAHHQLSVTYRNGLGVEKDEKKALYHTEQAAIAGHPQARHNLGVFEMKNGKMSTAVKHFIISAKLGCDNSLDGLKCLYKDRLIGKEDFTAALRGYQAAIEAMRSAQREEAAEFYSNL